MPENEEEPSAANTTVPLMLSPWTVAENSSVSGTATKHRRSNESAAPLAMFGGQLARAIYTHGGARYMDAGFGQLVRLSRGQRVFARFPALDGAHAPRGSVPATATCFLGFLQGAHSTVDRVAILVLWHSGTNFCPRIASFFRSISVTGVATEFSPPVVNSEITKYLRDVAQPVRAWRANARIWKRRTVSRRSLWI